MYHTLLLKERTTSPCEKHFSQPGGTPARIRTRHSHRMIKRKKAIIDKSAVREKPAPPQQGPFVILVEERRWIPISTSPRYDYTLNEADVEESTEYSSTRAHVREPDETVHWPELIRECTRSWICDKWLNASSAASDRVWFERSWLTWRASVHQIDTRSQRRTQNWSTIFHVAGKSVCVESIHLPWSSNNYKSIVDEGLIAGGTVDPLEKSLPVFFFKNSPRTSLEWYTINIRKDQITMQCTPFWNEDRTRPSVDILSNQQLCDYSVRHHAIRSIDKSCEDSQFGDINSIRYKICKRYRRYTLIQLNWNGRTLCANEYGSSTE